MVGSTRPPVKSPEDPLYASEVNWLREQVERDIRMPSGYVSDAGVQIGSQARGPYTFYAFNEAAIDIPAYSLFTIKYDERAIDKAYVRPNLAQHGVDGTPLLLCTNGSAVIKGGGWGVARPVPFNEPVRIWTETEIPVGHMAGPRPGTYEAWANGCGMVVLSKRDSDYLAQWMLRAPEPVGFIGHVTEAITAAGYSEGTPPTWTLGVGRIRLLRKHKDNNTLEDAKNPGEADTPSEDPMGDATPVPWDVQVYSRRSWQVPVDTTVRGTYVMGVGLVIDDNPGVLYGKTQSLGAAAGGAGVLDLLKIDGTARDGATADFSNLIGRAMSGQKKVIVANEAFTMQLVAVEFEESCATYPGFDLAARQMLVKAPNAECPVLVTVGLCPTTTQ